MNSPLFAAAPAATKSVSFFELILGLAPILVVVVGGSLLMLAEAFSKVARRGGARGEGEDGASNDLAIGAAVTLFAGAIVAAAIWIYGPDRLPALRSLEPYFIMDRFSLFFCFTLSAGGGLAALLAVWSWGEASVVKVAGTGLQALATAGATDSIWVGPCTTKEALAAMMHMHGGPAPFTEERGMVAARRAVWRLLTALTGESWPNSGSRLQAAMRGWKWARYGPEEPDADQALFLVLEDPRRGVAWATSAWVTD